MEMTVVEEPFFLFPKLEPFTDSIFNTLVKEKEDLPTFLLTLSITHLKVEDDSNYMSLNFSDDNS